VLALALCALPGLFAWLAGRRLQRRLDDPLLPERLQRHRQQVTRVAVPAILAGLWISGGSPVVPALGALWTLCGFFPLRRAVFAESWGLLPYLDHHVRLLLALAGPLLLVAGAPVLALSIGPPLWIGGLGCAVLALAWGQAAGPVLVRLLRARPLRRPDLEQQLAPVTARARVPPPELLETGPPGALWVNAFALLRRGRDGVLFTRSLLAEFPADEVCAIHAHELAHLEHIDARARRRRGLAFTVLVLVGCFAWPGLLDSAGGRAGPGALSVLAWAWALVLLVAVLAGQARHQAHESESDRRAVELCQDPEALVRALVRLSTLARLPRRFAPDVERASTHPSLARRIQAIRARAAHAPGTPPPATAVPSTTAGAWAIVESGRSHWLEGVPEATPAEPEALLASAARSQSVSHAELVELRLEVTGSGVRLRATEREGRVRSLPIREADAAAVQAALDHADLRLGSPPPVDNRLALAAGLLAPILLVLAATGGAWSALLPGLVALLHAGPAPLGSLGVAALGEALIRARSGPPHTLAAPFLGAFGAVAVAVAAIRLLRGGPARRVPALAAVLVSGLPALFTVLAMAAAARPRPHLALLHQAAAGSPRSVVLLLAASAAFALGPWRPARWVALPGVAAAGALLLAGTSLFGLGPGADPALGPVGRVLERPATAEVLREARLDRPAAQLRISPLGSRFAVRIGGDEGTRFRVGDFAGTSQEIDALDLGFLGEDRLAVLEQAGDASALVVRDLELRPLASWPLPALESPRLLVDPWSGRWRAVGHDQGQLVLVEGDAQAQRVSRFPLPQAPLGRYQVPYAAEGSVLLVTRGIDGPGGTAALLVPMLLGLAPGGASHLQVLTPDGPGAELDSSLPLACAEPPPGGPGLVCLAFDPRGTTLALFRAGQVRGTPLGRLRGYAGEGQVAFFAEMVAVRRWSDEESEIALLDLARSGEARLLGGLPGPAESLAAGQGVLGLLVAQRGGARVVMVRLPG
jgi:Zn-dependent protease with chaperone function